MALLQLWKQSVERMKSLNSGENVKSDGYIMGSNKTNIKCHTSNHQNMRRICE